MHSSGPPTQDLPVSTGGLKLVLVGRLGVAMWADTNGHLELLITNVQHVHELLPISSHPLSVGHPRHGPLVIRVEMDRGKEMSHNL